MNRYEVDTLPSCPKCGGAVANARIEDNTVEILGFRVSGHVTLMFSPCMHYLQDDAAVMWWDIARGAR